MLEIVIDTEEFRSVMSLAPFVDDDERRALGSFWVFSDGTTRKWAATDNHQLVVVRAGTDDRVYTRSVSPRVLHAWPGVSAGHGRAILRIQLDDDATELSGPGGRFDMVDIQPEPIDFDDITDGYRGAVGSNASAVCGRDDLLDFLRAARVAPFSDDSVERAPFWLSITESGIGVDVDWPGLGASEHVLTASTSGEATMSVIPEQLITLLGQFEPGHVTITIPSERNSAVGVEQPGRIALLMPLDHFSVVDERVVECIESVFGPVGVHRDDDGDFTLAPFGVPVYGRMLYADPVVLRLFSIVITGIEETDGLLEELNELNTNSPFARVVLVDDSILAMGELIAESIDDVELESLHRSIDRMASDIGPTLSAVFGGTPVPPGELLRWSDYLDARIGAQLSPGRWAELVGPDATTEWDLPGEMWMITAYDPFGRQRPTAVNIEEQASMAHDLTVIGAPFVDAYRQWDDNDERQPGLLVWDVDGDAIEEIARRYHQEAVFRLTASEVEVVGTMIDHRVSGPRSRGV